MQAPAPLLPGSGRAGRAGDDDATWAIDPIDRAAYENLFYDITERSGGGSTLGGAAAFQFFMQSGLPSQTLAAIWSLSDIDDDGYLDREEFAVAMQLCRKAKKGVALPQVLPRVLVPQKKSLYYNVAAESVDQWESFDANEDEQSAARLSASKPKGQNSASSSMMPHYALPGASFEQRMSFESELGDAMKKRQNN